jgi:hypothetical protein
LPLDDFKPTAYVPFRRWFTDERARDEADLRALYRQVDELYQRSPYAADDAVAGFGAPIWFEIKDAIHTLRGLLR